MLVIAGPSSSSLAHDISRFHHVPCIQVKGHTYHDGEITLLIKDSIKIQGEHVVIVQSLIPPINDHLIALLRLIAYVKNQAAQKIDVVIPYYAYSRQDSGDWAMNKFIAENIKNWGADRLMTIDVHSPINKEGMSGGLETINLSPYSLFLPFIEAPCVLVAPDHGSAQRLSAFAHNQRLPLVIMNKTRHSNGECTMMTDMKDHKIEDAHCIIVDDILDSGETLCSAANILKRQGAEKISAWITHALMGPGCLERLKQSSIDTIYTTDTIPHHDLDSLFQVVGVSGLLTEAI